MPFEIVIAKRPAKCQNCGKIIPTGQKKLKYSRLAGQHSVSKSCCKNCAKDLLEEVIFNG